MKGKGKTRMSRLVHYMRSYGGAGIQGFHKDSIANVRFVRAALEKMLADRETASKRGPKFVIVAVDTSRIKSKKDVLDLEDKVVEDRFLRKYQMFEKMYKKLKDEGVVVITAGIPRSAVMTMRAFRGIPSEARLRIILAKLLGEVDESTPSDELSDLS